MSRKPLQWCAVRNLAGGVHQRVSDGSLSVILPQQRGEHRSLLHSTADGVADLTAGLWIDRQRRYFISSASTTLPEDACQRVLWRQVEIEAERVLLSVPIPQVAECTTPAAP